MAIPGNFLSAVTEQVDPDTSGWAAVLNCTKSLGSGGRNGDGVLTLTSVASGEMQASTTAAYPVAAGTLYQAFADASSANQAERIGLLWLDADYVSVSTTWSLTTSTASATWHRISVAGVAPAGAVYARAVLSATPTAAAKTHFFENVYLGPPKRTSGNLLTFNAESGGDLDGTAWAADANCTVTRDAPMVSWSVGWYLSGGEVVKATTTANGNMSAVCTETPAVIPGTDYEGYAYLNPPASGSAAWVELRWYDTGGTLLSSKRSTLDTTGTGWYRQRISGVAPGTAATVKLAVGITSATAGQVLRSEGAVILPASVAPVTDGTVVPYEDASFEQGVGQWAVGTGVATIARSSPWGGVAFDGSYSLKVTSSTATTSVLTSGKYPVTAGVSWRGKVYFTSAVGTNWQASTDLRWYDAGGVAISSTTPDLVTPTGEGTSTWWGIAIDATAPSGAVTARIEVTLVAPSAGAVGFVDAATLVQTEPQITVTVDDEHALMTVVSRELTVGKLTTLYRIVGAAQSVVRGPDGPLKDWAITAAQMVVEDYEAPLGVDVVYRQEIYAAGDTTRGSRILEAVQLTVADPSDCWIKDPLQPQRNVMVQAATAPDWTRPIEQTEYRVRGRRNSVILSDVRAGLTGDLDVWTLSDEQRQALHFALDTGNALLIQFAPGLGLEDAYFVVGDATEGRLVPYGGEPRRRWTLALTQTDAPVGGVGGSAGWTVQDVLSTYATVQDVFDSYATVLDLVLDNREA